MSRPTKIGLVQLCAGKDVAVNLQRAGELISDAVTQGASVVLLPEAFAYIGDDAGKRAILESLDPIASAQRPATPILDWCRLMATSHDIDLIAGGFHEASADPTRSYNTCVHFAANGRIVERYRKIHLFDVALDDGTVLNESARTLPGDRTATTELAFGTLGLSVCYDLRFPYLYQQLVDQGAVALCVPSAFTATTGAAHWHTLLKARAIETQCYVLAPAQHGQHNERRRSYGHSLIIDPWGRTLAELPDGDGVVVAQIDPAEVQRVRRQLPSLEHRRHLN